MSEKKYIMIFAFLLLLSLSGCSALYSPAEVAKNILIEKILPGILSEKSNDDEEECTEVATEEKRSGEDKSEEDRFAESHDDFDTEEIAEDFSQIETIEQVIRYINMELSKGHSEISFESSTLDFSKMKDINQYLDGFYGNVVECRSEKIFFSKGQKITLICDISDNFYVEEYFLREKEIPKEREHARLIAEECENILKEMRKDLGENPSYYSREMWIHDYLVDKIAYGFVGDKDNVDDESHNSYGAIVLHKAVCNGYAYGMKLLCDLSDLPCKIVSGYGKKESHAWNMVRIKDFWYHVDVTWDDPSPDQPGRVLYTYFNVTDDFLSLTHDWERDKYPKAYSKKHNYYRKHNRYCKDYDSFKKTCISLLKEDRDLQSFQVMVADYDSERYRKEKLEFLFDYTDYRSMNYHFIGEAPYITLYITFQ